MHSQTAPAVTTKPASASGSRVSPSTAKANSSLALHAAMLRGAGIALLPAYVVDEDLRRGAAVQVLPELAPKGFSGDRLYAVYLENRFLPPKVRVFIDYLLETIGPQQG